MKIRLKIISISVFLMFLNILSVYAENVIDADAYNIKQEDDEKEFENSNLNLHIIYGQYNYMNSSIDFSSQKKRFAYLLNSNIRSSNDYGYNGQLFENTSYHNNKIGFTGNFILTEKFKAIIESNIITDSRGMYDNLLYSREEKDSYTVKVKNLYKITPAFETYLTFNNSGFSHRLSARQDIDQINSRLTKYEVESGGEYIWSDFNRIYGKILYSEYNFSYDEVDPDKSVKAEIVDDFKISDYIGITLGLSFNWNKEIGVLAWNDNEDIEYPIIPIIGFSIRNLYNFKFSMKYVYDIESFSPEKLYFDLNYIIPEYNLPSSKVHYVKSSMIFSIDDFVDLDIGTDYKKYENYLNFIPISGDVLSVYSIKADTLLVDCNFSIYFYNKVFRIISGYKFFKFKAEENIIYKPAHQYEIAFEINSDKWFLKYSNQYQDKIFIDPDTNEQLNGYLVGNLDIQKKFYNNLFAYLRIENLYNKEFFIRDGYPEPGIVFSGGLKIQI